VSFRDYDFAIIGAGIVGLATALEFIRSHPASSLLVLEKEDRAAVHQTGHNSGVIHSGIYYKPGSEKARMCVEGAAEMVIFCRENNLPHENLRQTYCGDQRRRNSWSAGIIAARHR